MATAHENIPAMNALDSIAEPFEKRFYNEVIKAFPPQSRLVRLWARCLWRVFVLREYLREGEDFTPEDLGVFWDEKRRLAKASWDRNRNGFGWREHLKAFSDVKHFLEMLDDLHETHILPRFPSDTNTRRTMQLACTDFEALASHLNPAGCSEEKWEQQKRFWKSARSRS